jgi:hypothetical protein
MVKVLLLVLALVGVSWVLMRIRGGAATSVKGDNPKKLTQPAPAKPASRSLKQGNGFSSVTILSGFSACEAAKALQDQVFLATDAPSLPLTDCDNSHCRCRYDYLDDRRQEDRRSPYGENHGAQIGSNDSNRRHPGDRRG